MQPLACDTIRSDVKSIANVMMVVQSRILPFNIENREGRLSDARSIGQLASEGALVDLFGFKYLYGWRAHGQFGNATHKISRFRHLKMSL